MIEAKEYSAVLQEVSTFCTTGTPRCQHDDWRFSTGDTLGVLDEYEGIPYVRVDISMNHMGEFAIRLYQELEEVAHELDFGFLYQDATREEVEDLWGF